MPSPGDAIPWMLPTTICETYSQVNVRARGQRPPTRERFRARSQTFCMVESCVFLGEMAPGRRPGKIEPVPLLLNGFRGVLSEGGVGGITEGGPPFVDGGFFALHRFTMPFYIWQKLPS